MYPTADAALRRLVRREVHGAAASKPRFLDTVRSTLRTRHYSRRTEEAYVAWIRRLIRRFIVFHGKRHPADMGAAEVSRFLTWLAVDRQVAASTQNQALGALLFLYRAVLEVDLPWLDDVVRARRPERLPIVLTRDGVRLVLDGLTGAPGLMAYLATASPIRFAIRSPHTCSRAVTTSAPCRSFSVTATSRRP